MDMSQYKDEFLSEAKDHIDTINEGLLVLEKNSEDTENINNIFRSFHTLKGNAATMGFMKFSELAHDLENVLDKVRNKEIKADSVLADLLFEGVDLLETGMELISDDQPEKLDATEIMTKVGKFINKDSKSSEVITADEKTEISDDDKKKIDKIKLKRKNVLRVIVSFDPTNPLKNIKALLLFKTLPLLMDLIKSFPTEEEIKTNGISQDIDLILGVDEEKESLGPKIQSLLSGISNIIVLELDEKYEPKRFVSSAPVQDTRDDSLDLSNEKFKKEKVQSVKIDIKRLDNLLDLVGELLISNIRLIQINKKYQIKELENILKEFDRLILDIQDEVMEERMIPIGNIFNRYPRMVRDLAKKQGKKINLIIEGDEIEFDRTILDEIGDPLVHLLRNAVDHGVESPQDRLIANKEEIGIVKLVARREKNNALVEVSDNGAGINPQKVMKAMIKKGILTEDEAIKMTDNELQRLIFRPGVSTNENVTEISGRGVGMDVVETKVKSLGGNVKLSSIVGEGSKITLQLPLTVAIVTSLLIKVSGETYAIPLTSVDRTVDIQSKDIKEIVGKEVFILQETEIPLLYMHDLINKKRPSPGRLTVIIVEKSDNKVGLVIDEIIAQEQILIKSLDEMIKKVKGFSGATILGDGNVALILDIATLID